MYLVSKEDIDLSKTTACYSSIGRLLKQYIGGIKGIFIYKVKTKVKYWYYFC